VTTAQVDPLVREAHQVALRVLVVGLVQNGMQRMAQAVAAVAATATVRLRLVGREEYMAVAVAAAE
jgi:hypothetical protein